MVTRLRGRRYPLARARAPGQLSVFHRASRARQAQPVSAGQPGLLRHGVPGRCPRIAFRTTMARMADASIHSPSKAEITAATMSRMTMKLLNCSHNNYQKARAWRLGQLVGTVLLHPFEAASALVSPFSRTLRCSRTSSADRACQDSDFGEAVFSWEEFFSSRLISKSGYSDLEPGSGRWTDFRAGREHPIFRDDHDPVLDNPIFVRHVGAGWKWADDHVRAKTGVLINDGAFDLTSWSDADGRFLRISDRQHPDNSLHPSGRYP